MSVQLVEETEIPRVRFTAPVVDLEEERAARAAADRLSAIEKRLEEIGRPRRALDEATMVLIERLSRVLAIRVMMAMAILGAFVLTLLAMADPTMGRLAVVMLWSASTIGPLTWLSYGGQK